MYMGNIRDMSAGDFLELYREFAVAHGLSESGARVYAGKLRKLLDNGYSVADLCGAVEKLIEQHQKGGECYDPADHNNTLAALKWLLRFIMEGCEGGEGREGRANHGGNSGNGGNGAGGNGGIGGEPDVYIYYREGWSSFRPLDRHMVSYVILGKKISVKYDKGFSSDSLENKSIPDDRFAELVDILKRYSAALSASDTAIRTVHDVVADYAYRFDGRQGMNCGRLFESDAAMDEYRAWLAPFVS